MTACGSVEEDEQVQSIDYSKTYTSTLSQGQSKHDHGLLYSSSYPCEPNMDEQASSIDTNHPIKKSIYSNDDCDQVISKQQQQQQLTNYCTNNIPSFFGNNIEPYNITLNSTIQSSSNTLSFDKNVAPLLQHQHHYRSTIFEKFIDNTDLIDKSNNGSPLATKNQPFKMKKIFFQNQYHSDNIRNTSGVADNDACDKILSNSNIKTTPDAKHLLAQDLPKRYSCTFCGKKFVRPSSLTTHTYSHTGEKPFQCPVERCGRRFSVISNLRRHGKIHSSIKKNQNLEMVLK